MKMPERFDTGQLVISLDFELFWGVRDKRSIAQYGPNILAVQQVIPALLGLFDRYEVKGTFSTVGFLFARNKEELLQYCPKQKPAYTDPRLSPYGDLATAGNDEAADPYHFGYSLLKKIQENGHHEIGTHTFCHYYCLEPGQQLIRFPGRPRSCTKHCCLLGIENAKSCFPAQSV